MSKKFNELKEDIGGGVGASSAPANNVGSGNIAGLGIGSQGEPPGPSKRKKSSMFKRKTPVNENTLFGRIKTILFY